MEKYLKNDVPELTHTTAQLVGEYIDTHCHLNMLVKETFDRILTTSEETAANDIIQQANNVGVHTIINVGTSMIESKNCYALAVRYPAVYATIGIHPTDGTHDWRIHINEFKKMILQDHRTRIVGIGECGIDLYHKPYDLALQKDIFKAQIELALEYKKVLVIHSRNAAEETLMTLEPYAKDITNAVMHCFSYSLDIAHEIINRGFLLGIDAPITYPKNISLQEVVRSVPLSSLVLETDAPFLPPQKERGKKNYPHNIPVVAREIAILRSEPVEHIAQQTTINAQKLFTLP